MHCYIGIAIEQRTLHFFHKDTLPTHRVQWHVGSLVTERLDQHQFDEQTGVTLRQRFGDSTSLRSSLRAGASGDTQDAPSFSHLRLAQSPGGHRVSDRARRSWARRRHCATGATLFVVAQDLQLDREVDLANLNPWRHYQHDRCKVENAGYTRRD